MVPRKYLDLNSDQAEFADWLKSFDFDTFATFTTGDMRPESEKKASPLPENYLTLAACRRMANRFWREFPKITMFWAAEPFSIRRGYHFHALIRSGENGFIYYDDLKPYTRANFWEFHTGFKRLGRSDFQPIKKAFGENWTAEYITKYISKGLADYDIISPEQPAEKPEYFSPQLQRIIDNVRPDNSRQDKISPERLRILQKINEKRQKRTIKKRIRKDKTDSGFDYCSSLSSERHNNSVCPF